LQREGAKEKRAKKGRRKGTLSQLLTTSGFPLPKNVAFDSLDVGFDLPKIHI